MSSVSAVMTCGVVTIIRTHTCEIVRATEWQWRNAVLSLTAKLIRSEEDANSLICYASLINAVFIINNILKNVTRLIPSLSLLSFDARRRGLQIHSYFQCFRKFNRMKFHRFISAHTKLLWTFFLQTSLWKRFLLWCIERRL